MRAKSLFYCTRSSPHTPIMKNATEFTPRTSHPRWEMAVELLCNAAVNGFTPTSMLTATWLIETEAFSPCREACPRDYVGVMMGDLAIAEAHFMATTGHWNGSTENYDPDPRGLWFPAVAALIDMWGKPVGYATMSWHMDGPSVREELAAFRSHLIAMADDLARATRSSRAA